MILFHSEQIKPILEGRKTETRRFWKDERPRVRVGGVYQARTRMLDKSSTFAHLLVKELRWEPLDEMTDSDAQKEGYANLAEFKKAFMQILKINYWLSNEMVWVVGFEVMP